MFALYLGQPFPCAYLPDRDAVLEHLITPEMSPAMYEHWLDRGWRRFGYDYFRARCADCQQCVSLRIPTFEFQPTKNQRRALKNIEDLQVRMRRPHADADRMDLWLRWHAMRENTVGWPQANTSQEDFDATFFVQNEMAWEIDYYDGEKLIAVGFVDETPNALSSVYFFYDPEYAKLSLGVASILLEIGLAKSRGKKWYHLGYRIRECPSTNYKSRYRPHEMLVGRPEWDQPAVWLAETAFPEPPEGALNPVAQAGTGIGSDSEIPIAIPVFPMTPDDERES